MRKFKMTSRAHDIALALSVIVFALVSEIARAETRNYGAVSLEGLAKHSWPLNRLGPSSTMVCNVNGSDGFLTVRSHPNQSAAPRRRLKRLAIVEVDTRERVGKWVKVVTAYRNTTTGGANIPTKNLHVAGWAHSDHLCDFIH